MPAGTRLDGDFEIERVLAASGFSVVYRAVDRALGRPVAIKEYLPASLALHDAEGQVVLRAAAQAEVFERGRAAFMEESRQLASCEHPSLVHLLRVWESRGTAYRAMPCYPGKTLLELREAMRDPPDEAALRALLDGLLGALGALHQAGLVHGAVAPDHILLLPDDRPVLLDFGAVRRALVGSSAQGLMALLEPSFAPMERIAGAAPDAPPQGPWTDLYSVAALLRYCIGGRLPAPATLAATPPLEPMAEVLRRLREHSPKARYSAELLRAIDATLAPRPNDRPQSVAEFRALLDGRLDPSALRADARVRRSAAAAAAVADSVPRASPAAASPPAAASAFGAGEAARAQVPLPARPPFDREEPAFIEEPSDESVVAALERAMASITPAAATSAPAAPSDGARRTARSYEAPRRAAARQGEPRQRRVVWSSAVALLMALGAIGWELSHQWSADQVKEAVAGVTGQIERGASETFARVQASVSAALDRAQGQATPAADAPLAARPAAPTAAGTSTQPSAPGSPATDAATASLRAADAALAGATVVPPLPDTAGDARVPNRAPPAGGSTTARADATAPTSTAPLADAPAEPAEALPSAPMAAAPAPVQQAAVPQTQPPAPAAPARTARAAPPSRATVARAASRSTPSARDGTSRRSVAAAAGRAPAEMAAAPAPLAAAAPPVVEAAPPPRREAVVAKGPASPREAFGERTQFALYYCMQTQCEQSQWAQHAQCKRLRDRDEVD